MNSPKSLKELYQELNYDLDRTTAPTTRELDEFERRLADLDALRLAAPDHERAELNKLSDEARGRLVRARAEFEHPPITSPRPTPPESLNAFARAAQKEQDGYDR